MHRLFVALFFLFVSACSEFGIGNELGPNGGRGPDIRLEPATLEFGTLRAGEQQVRSFLVRNVGNEALRVSDLRISAGLAFELVEPPAQFRVEPGDARELDVAFSPVGQDRNFGQVLVASNDPDEPEAKLDLLGLGDVPDLVIEPATFDFGQAFVPCGGEVELTLSNVGSEELVLSDIAYDSLGGFQVPLSQLRGMLPLQIASGGQTNLTVTWEPQFAGLETGTLSVWSNDPGGVEVATQTGEGAYVRTVTEEFLEPSDPAVDIIFLIDNSCSMEKDNEATLIAGLPSFFSKLRELSDWQLIQVTKGTGCGNGGVIDASTPNVETLFAANAFGSNVSELISEALLEHATLALSETGPGGCNYGALRDGALLHVIVASDEPERSGTSWQTHVNTIESYVSDPKALRISGIVDLYGKCGLGDPVGPGGYEEAANATGGMLLDICTPNWGDDLPDLAEQPIDGARSYTLSEPAVRATIEVTVNGVPTTGFTYGDVTQTITVTDPPIGEGDVVEVTYAVQAACR